MPAGNQILRWVLTLVVLGNCLPYFALEDVNRDRRVDLFDAVVQVRNMVDATQADKAVFITIQKAILAVSATAGLETVIQCATDLFDAGRLSMTASFLLSAFQWDQPSAAGLARPDQPVRFDSLVREPVLPPPELG